MSRMRKFFCVVLALLVFASLSTSVAFAQDPDNGKVLWEEEVWQCSRCHGPAGEGLWAGPRAGDETTAQEWIDQVRNPKRNMPTFSPEQVSDEQIIDMHAYITSLPKVEDFTPPDAGLPPDAHAGQQLIVENRCIACHGETGAIQGFIERGEVPTAEAVINQLRMPFKRMPSFSEAQVSDEEAALIADFMAQQVSEELPPETLPSSGSSTASQMPFYLLLAGGVFLTFGFALRKFVPRLM